jgi:hypothetical protein
MDDWTELIVTYDEIEAQIVKNILEAENIPVVVNSMKIRPYPVSIGRIGEVRLLVRAADIEKARDVIRIMKDIPSEEEQNGN